jgi:hypothetical protein
MERIRKRPVDLLIIELPFETELRSGPQSVSEAFLTKKEKSFEIRPSSEQITPNLLKLRNKEDDSTFYLTIPEVERFPCPVRNAKPGGQDAMSMYEVMIALLREWEKGNKHLRITSSINEIFGKIGQIQNKIIREDYYLEANSWTCLY